MKKLILIATALMAVNAEAATFTLYNYTDKPLVVHFAGIPSPAISDPVTQPAAAHDVNLPAASMQNGVWTPGQFSDVLDVTYASGMFYHGAYYSHIDFSGNPSPDIPAGYVKNLTVDGQIIDNSKHPEGDSNLSYLSNCDDDNTIAAFIIANVVPKNSCKARIMMSYATLNRQAITLSGELAQRFDELNKQLDKKLDALNTSIDTSVKNEVQHTDVVQTSVNNYLTTTSGNQTNLVNAVSTAMQSARDAARLDTKDYGPNNFYPLMTKQSSDGKYLVYPAQSFTLSGGCVLNAAPNNYLTVAHDANQEKNATQLLTAMVLGRRVEITQHQKDAETTDCGVIDSVKILDK